METKTSNKIAKNTRFLDLTDQIKTRIITIHFNTKEIKRVADNTIFTDENNFEKESLTMQLLFTDTKITIKETKKDLNTMHAFLIYQENLRSTQAAIYETLLNQFLKALKDYQMNQQYYKIQLKEKMFRQCKIIKNKITDNQLNDVIENGKFEILDNYKINENSKKTLKFIGKKYQEILTLCGSVENLHELFLELNLNIAHHEEEIIQVEDKATRARSLTVIETPALQIEKEKKSQKCLIC